MCGKRAGWAPTVPTRLFAGDLGVRQGHAAKDMRWVGRSSDKGDGAVSSVPPKSPHSVFRSPWQT